MMLVKAVSGRLIRDEIIAAGAPWHRKIPKGKTLRIVDTEDCQGVVAATTSTRYAAASRAKGSVATISCAPSPSLA